MKQTAGSGKLIGVKEAARLLGVSENFLYVHRELPSYRVGRCLKFDAQELRTFFKVKSLLGR
jgi:excisionase family DNA binding protein